jgi:hypothetical protein
MTKEHVEKVLDLYEHTLSLRAYSFKPPVLLTMFPLMRKMLENPNDWDKLMRWLGFVQGVYWSDGTFTIDQMRDHNRAGGSLDPSRTEVHNAS